MSKSSKYFTDKDTGYNVVMTQFHSSKGRAVFVGWLRSSGQYDHSKVKHVKKDGRPAKPPKNPGSISIAQIAAIHEFGSSDGTIPPRKPLRRAVEKNANKIEATIRRLLAKIGDKKIDEVGALRTLGEFLIKEIKAGITAGLSPGLKSDTIARKGGKSTPLIDTGQLINSVGYEVTDARKKAES